MRPSRVRVRMATVGLGLALALGLAAPATAFAQQSAPLPPRAPTIYHKSRSFRIPFNVDPSERARLKEVQLWVSDDGGFTWKAKSATTPDRPAFTFRASRDSEYWFAVRTLDTQGRLYPSGENQVEPSMKVIVDTKPPSLVLEYDGRRGSLAAVRWEVRDENLVLGSLVLEYQAEGARAWRKVPISRPTLIGREDWDAGTAEALVVRASVSDRAGNVTEATVPLPEGTASNPRLGAGDPGPAEPPPPISQISSSSGFSPVDEAPSPSPSPSPAQDPFPAPPPGGQEPAPAREADPFSAFSAGAGAGAGAVAGAAPRPPQARARTELIRTPRFPLRYAVDDAGPDGPSVVELWVTQDGGRTWNRHDEDTDRTSPFLVDLGGEGIFGLYMAARSASGLGDPPPVAGVPPQIWVEVDSTPPSVVLNPPQVGLGKHAGKVAITWRATDLHLTPRPVVLLWKPEQPGATWQPITPEPIANSGTYIWNVPASVPPRIHIRIEVSDTVGNRGSAETTETGSVLVDRSRPRSRIIGLDPSARLGDGSDAGPRR